MDNYNSLLNVICANEHFYDDTDLAKKFKRVFDIIPTELSVRHEWSSQVINRRVREYCVRHNMKVSEYEGPLPFRAFVIPINYDKA